MHQPFTINRNLLTCIKSTFSLISPGFRFIRFSLKKSFDRQITWVQKGWGGGWEDKSWQNIYYSSEQFALPISFPETRRTLCSAIEPQTAALCDDCWQALIGGDWWSFWPGPITARHSQGRAALNSPQNHGPGDFTVKAPGCSMFPSREQPRGLSDIYIDPVCICIGPPCLPQGNYTDELSLGIICPRTSNIGKPCWRFY